MLGLGNSLISSSKIKTLHFSYQSDFTSDDNSWTKDSFFHNGTPTITPNQGTGDAADGTGWLKIVYGADQTSFPFSGAITKNMLSHGDSFLPNDNVVVSFKVKLIYNGVDDHWSGTDDVTLSFGGYNPSGSQNIPLNTTTTVSDNSGPLNVETNRDVFISFALSGDKPTSGATWYLKDYSIQVFR